MLQCIGTECEYTGTPAVYEATYRVPFRGYRRELVCERHATKLEELELDSVESRMPAIEHLELTEL